MIPRTQFVKSRFQTSRLGFGTSRLHYLSSASRQRLLALAVDLGLTHIDTAPVYGDGLAEREVGRFVGGRRSTVVITTKFGIAADPLIERLPALAPALRPVRAVARRAGLWKMRYVPITGEGLSRSVESSLRNLRIDTIDILLLHEPMNDRIPSVDALLAAVTELRRRGLIRLFGLSGAWHNIAVLNASVLAAADVLQTAESEWASDRPPDITYGALTGAPQSAFGPKNKGPVTERLLAALARRANGTVLVSTTSADHLHDLASATEHGAR